MQALTPRLHMTSIDIANLVAGDGPHPPACDPRGNARVHLACAPRARLLPACVRARAGTAVQAPAAAGACARVCAVCVCARVRACVRACVHVYVYVCVCDIACYIYIYII